MQKNIERMKLSAIIEKYKLKSIDPIRKHEAIRFYCTKSFFTYILGPDKNASPVSKLTMAKEKHITNLAGLTIIAAIKKKHISRKNEAIPNAIPAFKYDLSFGKKLKTDNQPCGSGSYLPSTNP